MTYSRPDRERTLVVDRERSRRSGRNEGESDGSNEAVHDESVVGGCGVVS